MWNIFKSPNRKLAELMNSKKFIDSGYEVVKIRGRYALRKGAYYVDLNSYSYNWLINDRWFHECLGTRSKVIDAFIWRNPEIIDVKDILKIKY